MSLAGHDVGLDPLEVADGQVVGGVRVALVRRQPKVLHRLHLQRGDMRFIRLNQFFPSFANQG